jgi:hypothetical protein
MPADFEFDIVDKAIALIAKRNSGKSRLLRYILICTKKKFDEIFLVCPTECVNNFYKDFIKAENIFSSYSEEWVEKLIDKMTKANTNKTSSELKRVLIILDDVCSDENFQARSKYANLNKLFKRGRHIGISIILTAQYPMDISKSCRSNCDFILTGQLNTSSLDVMTNEFMFGHIEKKKFLEYYNKATSNYSFFAINCQNVKDNRNLNEIYGSIKCPEKYVK